MNNHKHKHKTWTITNKQSHTHIHTYTHTHKHGFKLFSFQAKQAQTRCGTNSLSAPKRQLLSSSLLLFFCFNIFPPSHLQIRNPCPRLTKPGRLGYRCVCVCLPWFPFALSPSHFYCVFQKTRHTSRHTCRVSHTNFFTCELPKRITPWHLPSPRRRKKVRLGCPRRRFCTFKARLPVPFRLNFESVLLGRILLPEAQILCKWKRESLSIACN